MSKTNMCINYLCSVVVLGLSLCSLLAQELAQTVPFKLLGIATNAEQGVPQVTTWDISTVTGHNNVKSFGAVGDGLTDDTVAIQKAIDNTNSNTVFLPKGVYKISSPLVIRGNLRIVGDGRGSTVIKQVSSSKNAFEMPEGQTLVTHYQDFTVQGTGVESSEGVAFYMQSATPNTWSNSHHWSRVDVEHFGTGYHCYWIPLAAWRDCRVLNCGKGWYMDRVDTPIWINCATGGVANSMSVGIDVVNGGFSGQIIGGEWGGTRRVFSIKGAARYTIIGGNIETNTNDGVIYIGPWASVSIKQLRISLPSPNLANNAVILVDAKDPNGTPKIEIGEILFDLAGGWRPLVIRGAYYYNVKPIVNIAEGAKFFYENATRSTVLTAKPGSLAQWPQLLWQNAYPNIESNNKNQRGDVVIFNVNDGSVAKWEHPVMFYRTRQGGHARGSLLNDRLMQVLHNQSSATNTSASNETNLVYYTIQPYQINLVGEAVIFEASGVFSTNSNSKLLKVFIGTNEIFNSTAQSLNGKSWSIKTKISRRNETILITSTTLIVDGELPKVRTVRASNKWSSASYVLRLTGTGGVSNDIVCEFADIVWRKSKYNE